MKNRKIWIFVLAVILLCGAVGSVSAFMVKRATGSTTPSFQSAEVDCEVSVSYEESEDGKYTAIVTVTNEGNVAAYLRVRLAINWVDEAENQYYKPNAISVGEKSGWIVEDNVCYYCEAVASKETAELKLDLGKVTFSVTEEKDGKLETTPIDVKMQVAAVAEAVQADPADAVADMWNVKVDADGKITGMKSEDTTGEETEETTGATTEETEEN